MEEKQPELTVRRQRIHLEGETTKNSLVYNSEGVNALDLGPMELISFGKLSALVLYFNELKDSPYYYMQMEELTQELNDSIKNHKKYKERPTV